MRPEFVVSYISMGSIIVPLVIAVLHRKSMSTDLRPLYFSLSISLICDVLAYFMARNSLNTHWVGNIYLATQFFLLVLVFRNQFSNRRIVDFILAIFILFFAINISFFQGPLIFNSISNIVACLILIAFCLSYFYLLLNNLPIVHIQHLPMLWISFGVLTYYGGNFFLFLVKNYLTYGEAGSHKIMWILHNLLNIAKNILFAIALWKSYRKVKSFTLSSSAP